MEITETKTDHLDKIAVVCGPTAVGKSTFAVRLAERIGGELVNADSVQLYRGVDIGTAKPSRRDRKRVSHHLYDVLELDEECNAADYVDRAKKTIAEIRARGNRPIVVGGTGLYIRILVHGIFEAPKPDEQIRQHFWDLAEKKGGDYLHEQLQKIDPDLAEDVHPNDTVRVIRGLEVYEQTGKTLSQFQREHEFSDPNYDALKLGLIRPRDELYDRINRRAEQMLEAGLLSEYRDLVQSGHSPELKPLQSLGYRQMGQYQKGQLSWEEAVDEMKKATRNYAKRQISWFRSEPNIQWAMAPVAEAEQLPEAVCEDFAQFFDGQGDQLDWANIEPYDVSRDKQ